MEARHISSFLRSCGELEMAEAVEQMDNRLEAFSLGMDRAAIDCAIRAAEELTAQRDELLKALKELLSGQTIEGLRGHTGLMDLCVTGEDVRAGLEAIAAVAKATGSAS